MGTLSDAYYQIEFSWQSELQFLSLEECLALIHGLPNQADSETPSRKQQGRQRQLQTARRKAQKDR